MKHISSYLSRSCPLARSCSLAGSVPLASPITLAILISLVVSACAHRPDTAESSEPRFPNASVILIVGDGLGYSLQEAVRILDGGLAVDDMPHTAQVRTVAEGAVVTDSAAAATAMATGRKTANSRVGTDADGKRLRTVAEDAKAAGKAVGFVTSAFLWDATPAAFFSHVKDRDDTDAITWQALAFGPDLLYGGGESYLLSPGEKGRFGPGRRRDGENLLDNFKSAGYRLVTGPDGGELPQLGLFAGADLFTQKPARYRPALTLEDMTTSALEALAEDPEGFFLLVEEEATDEMLHGAGVSAAVEAVRSWNRVVATALSFAERNPQVTVIVTSDHETGAFSLAPEKACRAPLGALDETAFTQKYVTDLEPSRAVMQDRNGNPVCLRAWTNGHTAEPVPLFTRGVKPSAAVIENTDIHGLLRSGLGLD